MKQLVFLLEEESMKVLLEVLLPKILPPETSFICIAHEGKQDLEKSTPHKLKAWRTPANFVIVRDKDGADCLEIKKRLVDLCVQAGRGDSLVRIACHELEAWLLGDLAAVEKAFGINKLSLQQQKSKFKEPDKLANASEELEKLVKGYRKVSGAKKIAAYMDIKQNHSHSFNCFISGVNRLLSTD
ncbi:MAG: DUF4276 family protein [Methylovulum sp.]|uniref:DUF4276 family protein n=1 Tax=Methylovulum sp. TaxID=1916980 RepID=UPI002616611B|nr:DUF4276 family protein [Methylovulum sp.]MDD2725062.1 DUF4276 family protein [Methylovulum sp.]MDD5125291.1 DUF4276 family protein [Methylovulum sp.]